MERSGVGFGLSTMNIPKLRQQLRPDRWMTHVMAWGIFMGIWAGMCLAARADTSMPENQVKALFLLNFTKYTEWPTNAFASADAPVVIGVYGESKVLEPLKRAVAGKSAGGRSIEVRQLADSDDPRQCQILFVSDSAAARMRDILDKVGAEPILTVGEDAAFAQNGGVINFILKNGNVRLEIDLAAARKSGLTISSRLLSVADVVKGKAK
jgi:hypothetical protein